METIMAAIVSVSKPFFTYNAKGCKHLPTIVDAGSEAITTLELGDVIYEADTIDQVMVEFDKKGFKMPEEDVWDFPERNLRIVMKNSDMIKMLKNYPELAMMVNNLKDFIVTRNGKQLIYLQELYSEHRVIIEQHSGSVEQRQ